MTTEQILEITENGEYKNIQVKTQYEWDKNAKQFKFDPEANKIVNFQGVKPDHYIVVEKGDFAEGYPYEGKFGTSYSCRVNYSGEEVSFWLSTEWSHKAFAEAGDVNDKVKISCAMVEKLNKKLGVKVPVEVLTFEKVE